jgi:Holliday junction DNA helicase RuvB
MALLQSVYDGQAVEHPFLALFLIAVYCWLSWRAIHWALRKLGPLGIHYESPAKIFPVKASYREIDTGYLANQRWAEYAALGPRQAETAMRALYGDQLVDYLKAESAEAREAAVAALTRRPPEAAPEQEADRPVQFRPGEPTTFAEVETHRSIALQLEKFVAAVQPDRPATRPLMFLGGAGRGKTTLVHVFANELRNRLEFLGLAPGLLVEAFGGDLDTAAKLDQKVRLASANPGSVLFIDEVHSMPRIVRERLYLLLDRDFRYQFEGDRFPSPLGAFTPVFATTDRGLLDEPMRTRCYILEVVPVPADELFKIAINQEFEVDPAAAELAVSRFKWDGSVRPLIQILDVAKDFARSRGSAVVAQDDVEDVFAAQGIDDMGLYPIDRDVVRALMRAGRPAKVRRGEPARTQYSLSEASLTGWVRLDKTAYREEVKPRLMERGFLVSLSGGQTLTDAGVAYARRSGLAA